MAIQDHYLPKDLVQLNEELLRLHNMSVTVIKNAQEGNFTEMNEHQEAIGYTIKVITALHNRKLIDDEEKFWDRYSLERQKLLNQTLEGEGITQNVRGDTAEDVL